MFQDKPRDLTHSSRISRTSFTHSSTEFFAVFSTRLGASGFSYFESIPVNPKTKRMKWLHITSWCIKKKKSYFSIRFMRPLSIWKKWKCVDEYLIKRKPSLCTGFSQGPTTMTFSAFYHLECPHLGAEFNCSWKKNYRVCTVYAFLPLIMPARAFL